MVAALIKVTMVVVTLFIAGMVAGPYIVDGPAVALESDLTRCNDVVCTSGEADSTGMVYARVTYKNGHGRVSVFLMDEPNSRPFQGSHVRIPAVRINANNWAVAAPLDTLRCITNGDVYFYWEWIGKVALTCGGSTDCVANSLTIERIGL
jgi:hypothetical protein